MSDEELGYDKTNPDSIVAYGQRLVGHTLREMTDASELQDPHQRRGSFGNAVEEYYFKYQINSDSAPDFEEAHLELKATPVKEVVKRGHAELVAKERLVLGMINYMDVVEETFETSHVMEKCSDVLLVTYLYDKQLNPLDYVVRGVARWSIPEEDIPQIKHDWETVVDKIRSGHAEDLSGSDTIYLEAATKASDSTVRRQQPYSDVPAKPRAWALKSSYMTAVQRKVIAGMEELPRSASERNMDLLELVKHRFSIYLGRTEKELQELFGLSNSKNLCARITNRILGVGSDSQIEEFIKAGIKPKTIRIKSNGVPKEAMSFPALDYFDLEETDFADSAFYEHLQQKYLFVLYREGADGEYRLSDVCFWQMPESDLPEAQRCYESMRENVRRGRADISAKITENRCCHVRPHARDKTDTRPQPYGAPVVKKCFWLNQNYLADEIARTLGV